MDVTINLTDLQNGMYCAALALSTVGAVIFLAKQHRKVVKHNVELEFLRCQNLEPVDYNDLPTPYQRSSDSDDCDVKKLLRTNVELATEPQIQTTATHIGVLLIEVEQRFRAECRRQAKERGLPEHETENLEKEIDRLSAKCQKGEMPVASAISGCKSWVNRRMQIYNRTDAVLAAVTAASPSFIPEVKAFTGQSDTSIVNDP